MTEKSSNNNYLKGELEEAKKPTPGLNQNSYRGLTSKEKAGVIVSSKWFTITASILTLGGYCLYYLFCLEQEHESPFTPSSLGKDRYKFEKSEDENEAYIEAKGINKGLCFLLSGKDPNKNVITVAKNEAVTFWEKSKLGFNLFISSILTSVESFWLRLTNKSIEANSSEAVRSQNAVALASHEERFRDTVNRKLQERIDKEIEFDLGHALSTSLAKEEIKPVKDYYLTFLFCCTYLLFSVVTLGLLPVYHLLLQRRAADFKEINKYKEHSYIKEFDNITEKLLGSKGELEYSTLLLSETRLPFKTNYFSDAFRTRVFKSASVRGKIVTFLMLITLGFFGVFVISRNVFSKEKLSIKEEDTLHTDYLKIENKWERFKMFVLDLLWDISVSSKIASNRALSINNSLRTLIKSNDKEDKLTSTFIKIISNELYLWLFAFISIFLGITIMILSVHASAFWFWTSFLGTIFFLFLFTRHIKLLFL